MVDLDPLAAMKARPSGRASSCLISAFDQRLALDRDLHSEIEQRIHPQVRRRLAAHRRLHLGMGRAVHAPARRHAQDHAGALQRLGVLQQLQRLRRTPAQRVVDFARIDHGLQPRAGLRRALHGHQQRQQTFAVSRSGIFLERPAERQMLRLAFGRKAGRVGRQERERGRLVLAVLGEIEVHAADQVPGGMAALEELLNGEPNLGQLDIESCIDSLPQGRQYGGRQVFRAGHGRRCDGHPLQRAVAGCRHGGLGPAVVDAGQCAKRRHIAGTEFPPV